MLPTLSGDMDATENRGNLAFENGSKIHNFCHQNDGKNAVLGPKIKVCFDAATR